jgi:hypothetical protein
MGGTVTKSTPSNVQERTPPNTQEYKPPSVRALADAINKKLEQQTKTASGNSSRCQFRGRNVDVSNPGDPSASSDARGSSPEAIKQQQLQKGSVGQLNETLSQRYKPVVRELKGRIEQKNEPTLADHDRRDNMLKELKEKRPDLSNKQRVVSNPKGPEFLNNGATKTGAESSGGSVGFGVVNDVERQSVEGGWDNGGTSSVSAMRNTVSERIESVPASKPERVDGARRNIASMPAERSPVATYKSTHKLKKREIEITIEALDGKSLDTLELKDIYRQVASQVKQFKKTNPRILRGTGVTYEKKITDAIFQVLKPQGTVEATAKASRSGRLRFRYFFDALFSLVSQKQFRRADVKGTEVKAEETQSIVAKANSTVATNSDVGESSYSVLEKTWGPPLATRMAELQPRYIEALIGDSNFKLGARKLNEGFRDIIFQYAALGKEDPRATSLLNETNAYMDSMAGHLINSFIPGYMQDQPPVPPPRLHQRRLLKETSENRQAGE